MLSFSCISIYAQDPGVNSSTYTKISENETNKLKAIRDSIRSIQNLDKLYHVGEDKNGVRYHYYIPQQLIANKSYPLVIFLHGHTDMALDIHNGFPKGVWTLPHIQEKYPHMVFAPIQASLMDSWKEERIMDVVNEALDNFIRTTNNNSNLPNIDITRIYLTGFSRGGEGAWSFTLRNPDKYAATVPLAGFSAGPSSKRQAEKIKHVPTWIFCGEDDYAREGSRISYYALKKINAKDVRYHEYEKQSHVIDDFAYFTSGFFEWLFSQRLKVE